MTPRIVTFGEVMLRLKSPGHERLLQSPLLEATFGGGEANVAASLALFGLDVAYVTVLPRNTLGDACLHQLRAFGVDTSTIVRGGQRLGTYYLDLSDYPATDGELIACLKSGRFTCIKNGHKGA